MLIARNLLRRSHLVPKIIRPYTTATEGNISSAIEEAKPSFATEEEIEAAIEKHYKYNHIPLADSFRKHGPPYTDVSEIEKIPHHRHFKPNTIKDKIAFGLMDFFRKIAHWFFKDKYTHHAVVLETVAAVPGMIGAMLRHMRSLRRMTRDHGKIALLVEEAENERMHLLTWMNMIQPTFLERLMVLAAQAFFAPFYATCYIISPTLAHRMIGYFEEEAVYQYTLFLEAIDEGKIPNVDAPEIAIKYWNLPPGSKLRDVVICVRADEMLHRDFNHKLAQKTHIGLH